MWYKNQNKQTSEVLSVFIPGREFDSEAQFGLPLQDWNPTQTPFILLNVRRHEKDACEGAQAFILEKHPKRQNNYLLSLQGHDAIRNFITHINQYKIQSPDIKKTLEAYCNKLPKKNRGENNLNQALLTRSLRQKKFYKKMGFNPEKFNAVPGGDPYQEYYSTIMAGVREAIVRFDNNLKKKRKGIRGFFPYFEICKTNKRRRSLFYHGTTGYKRGLKLQKKLAKSGNINSIIKDLIEHNNDGGGKYGEHSLKAYIMEELNQRLDLGIANIRKCTKTKKYSFNSKLREKLVKNTLEAQVVPDEMIDPKYQPLNLI